MKQNNEFGDLVTDYFILMELLIKDMDKWILVRNPEREGYKQLCEAINSNYKLTHNGKEANTFLYSNEADMINQCLLGAKAKQIRRYLEIEDDSTRDNLSTMVNQAIYELQLMDIALIMRQIDSKQRMITMQNVCDTRYKHISLMVQQLEVAV